MGKLVKKIKLVLSPIKSFIVGFATLLVIRVINRGDVVLLTNSLGDDVYGLSLLGDFKKSRNRKLTVIGLISRKKLIEFYRDSFDRMILLEIESSNWRRIVIIWRIRILMKIGQILNIYSMCPFHWLPEDRIEGRDVISVLRDEILKLPPRVNVVTPDFASEPITSIQDFDEICNRIVVLNPYSTTMRDISWSMFEEIAKFLKAKGYIVYTNIWRGDNKVIL